MNGCPLDALVPIAFPDMVHRNVDLFLTLPPGFLRIQGQLDAVLAFHQPGAAYPNAAHRPWPAVIVMKQLHCGLGHLQARTGGGARFSAG